MEFVLGKRIIEIIDFLAKELLEKDITPEEEENLIKTLIQLGYDIEEINLAFIMIFSVESRIEKQCLQKLNPILDSIRIFSPLEQVKMSFEAQNILMILRNEDLISESEEERILDIIIHQEEEVDKEILCRIIKGILHDEKRYILLTNHAKTVDFFLDKNDDNIMN